MEAHLACLLLLSIEAPEFVPQGFQVRLVGSASLHAMPPKAPDDVHAFLVSFISLILSAIFSLTLSEGTSR